jgi:hypothetical protein
MNKLFTQCSCRYLSAFLCLIYLENAYSKKFIIGHAFDIETQQLRYIEEHYFENNGYVHRVIYKEPNGEVFANKTLDYRHGLTTPTLVHENTRNGEKISISHQNSDKGNLIEVKYRSRFDDKERASELPMRNLTVIDAGFDHFIRGVWDDVDSHSPIHMEYVLPSRATKISLTVNEKECGSVDRACFEIRGSNWLTRIMVNPIVLEYDQSKKVLLRFLGTSNISTNDGKYEVVDIRYTYPG